MPQALLPEGAAGGAAVVAGWYGKLASLGDFASRRLSPQFVARWDPWLQQVMAASRVHLGSAWLDSYLSSPLWRFVEWPPCAEMPLHVGVLMPSVDKVGRYFPLCIAAALPAPPASEGDWRALSDWCERIEAAALATLDLARSAQQFDDALLALPAPLPRSPAPLPPAMLLDALQGAPGQVLQGLVAHDALGSMLAGAAAVSLARSAAGASLWWAHCADPVPLLACAGLPDAELFTAMLQRRAPDGGEGA